ncbi:MAG: DUF488 domain-containing protein [Acidobacteria bacterium]|nr:DUF488 domain-containing protein [Acidobacteriota bacterium]MDW7983483.1 DUF488 domain-containing protein [Acidobacteriota bacterium]
MTTWTVLTVGHSNRSLEDFIRLLMAHGIEFLADVRRFPGSRRNPQFNKGTLLDALGSYGILYQPFPELGGWRAPQPDSPHRGLTSPGFRGYADYMETPEFDRAVRALIDLTGRYRLAYMCAEALPWRCHRWLLSDALTVRGLRVGHILTPTRCQAHRLTPGVQVRRSRLIYTGCSPG